jgi:hypothetical protein
VQKSSLQKIFGSNLILSAREARGVPVSLWFFIQEARQSALPNLEPSSVVRLYELARTYFQNK